MTVELKTTPMLLRLVGGSKSVQGEGKTVGELLDFLEQRYPGLKAQVVTAQGKVRPFVNVYLNDEDIRFLGELEAPLSDGDVVTILPAIAGGTHHHCPGELGQSQVKRA